MKKLLAAAIGILVLVSIGAVVYKVGWGEKPGLGGANGSPSGASAPPGTSDDRADRFKTMTVEDSFAEVSRLAYEPYVGVLRGARGTLVSGGGNSLDKSVLLATMLRAQGHNVRFVSGPLRPDRATALLRGMYPAQLPEGQWGAEFEPFSPVADPALQAAVANHTWIEFERAGHWVSADPSVPGAKLGESYGEANANFPDPPAEAFQRVALTWRAVTEGGSVEEVGRIEGTVADLALQPISLVVRAIPIRSNGEDAKPAASSGAGDLFGGMFGGEEPAKPKPQAARSGEPGPLVGLRYERELLLPGGLTKAPSHIADGRKRGTAITREWVEGTVTGPGGLERRIERTLWAKNPTGGKGDPIGEVRRYGIGIFAGRVTHGFVKARLEEARGPLALDEAKRKADALPGKASGDEAEAAREEANEIERRLGNSAGWFLSLGFAAESDVITEQLAAHASVTVARGVPRIVISSIETVANRPTDAHATIGLDLRLDEVQAYPWPGRPARAAYIFQMARGEQESIIEGAVVKTRTGRPAVTAAAVMQQAPAQGLRLLTVTPEDREELGEAREMPAGVRTLVNQSVAEGRHIIIPEAAVTIEGRPRWGWWDLDPRTGALVGVMEGGGHQGTAEYTLSLKKAGIDDDKGFAIGMTVGAITTVWMLQAALLQYGEITPEVIKIVSDWVENGACNSFCPPKAEIGLQFEGNVAGDCLKPAKWKKEKMAKVTVAFCDAYHDGFKCAGGLILSWLKRESPGVGAKVEFAINLPNCKEFGPKVGVGNQSK